MKPFISLCMIVKNEEKVIERSLSSVARLVDEIIVVDTGSTDGTKEIAAKFTSNIYDFEWSNDFSAARNFASSKANGDWILVLDADEFVDEDNFINFIQEVKEDQNQFDAYTAKILNFTGNFGESLVQNFHDRVYKNNSEIVYYRKIHEQFTHIKGKKLNIRQSSLLIFHSGYLNQVVNEKDKRTRNNHLLDNEINESSNNAFDYFNYGNEYASEGNYSEALKCYLKAYKGKNDIRLNWVSTTLVQIIVCLMQLKRYNDALNIIKDAESMYTSSAEILFFKGEIFFLRGQLEDAKKVYHQIVDNQEKYNHIILRPDLKDQKPHTRLGEIYYYEEDYKNSIYHYTSVLNLNKYNEEAIRKIIYILDRFHSVKEISKFLYSKNLITTQNIKSYLKACFEVGNPSLAQNLLNNFNDEQKLLNQVTSLKKLCITNDCDIDNLQEILKYEVFQSLIQSNWVNIIDIFLLREFKGNENLTKLLKHYEKNNKLNTLVLFLDNETNTKDFDIDENLLLFSLQTLLNYKKYLLCNVLITNTEKLDKKVISKVANILYANGYKVEALQLYDKSDWIYFGEQDFINIIRSLLETNDKENAIIIAKYAMSIFENDFRFYQYILENTMDHDLFSNTINQAKIKFVDSFYLEKLIQKKL